MFPNCIVFVLLLCIILYSKVCLSHGKVLSSDIVFNKSDSKDVEFGKWDPGRISNGWPASLGDVPYQGDFGGPLVCLDTRNPQEISPKTGVLVGIACGHVVGVPPPLLRVNHTSDIVYNKSYLKDVEHNKWVARIMNGWPAKLGDVPYQISLKGLIQRARSIYKSFCGATIVSSRKLISAAHCFEQKKGLFNTLCGTPGKLSGRDLANMYAVAGNLKNTARYKADGPHGQWRTLESVTHPVRYRFPVMDIAVVITDNPFYFNSYVFPIPMAVKNMDYSGTCLASGFGRIGHGPKDQSGILLLAHLEVFSNRVCKKLFRKKMDAFICTGIRVTDVGKGDSGGPLVCANTGDPNERSTKQGVLVGVVSGHAPKIGSFFSRVSTYKKFIASVNSVSKIMYKYTMQSCTAISLSVLYNTFVLFRFVLFFSEISFFVCVLV